MTDPHRPRVVYLTAGGAGMYCGSCMRDNALATALTDERIDVTLVPLYTPIRTDDVDVSIDRVFFGGINVYLQQRVPLFRHLPAFVDRWLDHPGLLQRVASRSIGVSATQLGSMTLSMVRGEHGHQRKEVFRLVEWLRDEARPELLCLTNLLVGGSIPTLRRELPGVPILVTLQGDDLFLDELTEPWRTRVVEQLQRLAQQVDGFIVFTEAYRQHMSRLLQIEPSRFQLTALGVDADELAATAAARPGAPADRPPAIGFFARRSPEKGFDRIVDAFVELAQRPGMETLRLRAGGWLAEKDRAFYEHQVARLTEAGLAGRFDDVGSPDAAGKQAFFASIDVFSVPARFVEPKGLYVLEAMSAGLPVVQPDRGAFPELIEASGGGRLVPAGDTRALADALEDLLTDPVQRLETGRRGRAWVVRAGDRTAMARTTAAVFREFIAGGTRRDATATTAAPPSAD